MTLPKMPVILVITLAVLSLFLIGCENPMKPPPAKSPHVDFVMGISGRDWTVYLDGNALGRLSSSGQRVGRDVPAGGHSFYLRDHANNATSRPVMFNVSEGQVVTYTLGSGDTPINWDFDKFIRLSNLRTSILNSGSTVRLTVDLEISGYGGRSFAVGGYWLSQSGSSYVFVRPASGCSYNTPSNYMGRMFSASPKDNALYRYTASFDVAASCFPDRSSGKRYYGLFKLYSSSSVQDVNAPAITQMGPPGTLVYISFGAASQATAEASFLPDLSEGRILLDSVN